MCCLIKEMSEARDKGEEYRSRARSRQRAKQMRFESQRKIISIWLCSFPVFYIVGPEKIGALKLPKHSREIPEQTSDLQVSEKPSISF